LLTQAGEFGFVLFGSAHNLGLMDDAIFALAVGVISTSMLITPLLVSMGDSLVRWLESRPTSLHQPVIEPGEVRRVVIGGYGRVGHTIAVILHGTGIPFIAFDNDPEQVSKGQRDGFPVYFGNINESALWNAAHVEQAALVVLTIGNQPTAIRAVSYLRSSFPELQVISRARDLQACGQLLEAGANHAFPEMVESSMRLGAQVLEIMGVPSSDVNSLLSGVRRTNYSLVREDTTI
jgi:glutathione-regulated potassium-efflux system protein KefB